MDKGQTRSKFVYLTKENQLKRKILLRKKKKKKVGALSHSLLIKMLGISPRCTISAGHEENVAAELFGGTGLV